MYDNISVMITIPYKEIINFLVYEYVLPKSFLRIFTPPQTVMHSCQCQRSN